MDQPTQVATLQADAPSRRPLLRVEGVSVRFGGVVALQEVSFDVERGGIYGLIGPNGAGKSTLFNCLSRLYEWSDGRIELDGRSLGKVPRHRIARMGIGRTFQNLALFRSMTVRDNVLVGCHPHHKVGFLSAALRLPVAGRVARDADLRASRVMDDLGLAPVAERPVAELTFGMQKRVELARALASEPRLLLLDEPACGLNHEEVQALREVILRIRHGLGITVLLVEHHMGLVMSVCERIVALSFGRKIAEGTPAEVKSHPEVIRAYLGRGH